MNHRVATEEVQEQAALYTLGALSQLEARRFESHLGDGCDVCNTELIQFSEVSGLLGLAASEADPPPSLRGRLLERIGNEAQQPAQKPSMRSAPAPKLAPSATPIAARRSPTGWIPWAIAACLAIFSIASIVAWRRADDQIAQVRKEADRLQVLTDQARESADEANLISGVLESPGHVTVDLIGTADHTSSTGQVYWDKQRNRWVVVTNLPPAPAGKAYQLWFLAPSPVSAGMIKTNASGHGFSVIQIPQDLGQIGAAAITLEPEGGSEKPTMPIYALGKTTAAS